MRTSTLRGLWHLFLIITLLGGVIALASCSPTDDLFDGGWTWPAETETFDYEVGPEGSVIEITNHSSIRGFKIEIPEGALADTTKITVTRGAQAPALPDGLDSGYYPVIGLTADAPFLKEIQIHFPISDSHENSENMICAFYWDSDEARWQVIMPERIGNGLMTVQTDHFSNWQWGEVLMDEVEGDTLGPLYDQMYGTGFFDELEAEIESTFDQLNFSNYCDNRQEIDNFLLEKKNNAKDGVGEALTVVSEVCNVCGLTPNDFISVGISEIIEVNIEYYWLDVLVGPSRYWVIMEDMGIVGKHWTVKWYESRMENLSCDYPCIFENSDFTLWGNMWLYYAADAAMLAVDLAEMHYYSCD